MRPVGALAAAIAGPGEMLDASLPTFPVATPAITATEMAARDTTAEVPSGRRRARRRPEARTASWVALGSVSATVAEPVAIRAATTSAEPTLGSATHDHTTKVVLGTSANAGR